MRLAGEVAASWVRIGEVVIEAMQEISLPRSLTLTRRCADRSHGSVREMEGLRLRRRICVSRTSVV